jgi:glycosyltransferase involved in cell wall biosynthesis
METGCLHLLNQLKIKKHSVSTEKKVCLITPNHIATNPRLVKEAMALSTAGYKVHIVFTQHVPDVIHDDEKILNQNPSWTFNCLNWASSNKLSKFRRIYSGILHKSSLYAANLLEHLLFSKIILNRNYHYQVKKAIDSKADFFIAHNIGALAVAANAAAALGKRYAFDAEDYHRGELLDNRTIKAIIKVEDSYIPKATYISAASPLIAKEYDRLYAKKVLTINNVFPLIERPDSQVQKERNSLKLFWFSQSVGLDRGLQDVFSALKLVEDLNLEFHIYGKLTSLVKTEFDVYIEKLNFERVPQISYCGLIAPDDLLLRANDYDIGFAIEPGFCKNNEIALSNKIFTYLLGGNAIIFTDTPAQSHFFEHNKEIGFIYPSKDAKKLAFILRDYYKDRNLLKRHKVNSRKLFEEKFNWNKVQFEFLDQVRKYI